MRGGVWWHLEDRHGALCIVFSMYVVVCGFGFAFLFVGRALVCLLDCLGVALFGLFVCFVVLGFVCLVGWPVVCFVCLAVSLLVCLFVRFVCCHFWVGCQEQGGLLTLPGSWKYHLATWWKSRRT